MMRHQIFGLGVLAVLVALGRAAADDTLPPGEAELKALMEREVPARDTRDIEELSRDELERRIARGSAGVALARKLLDERGDRVLGTVRNGLASQASQEAADLLREEVIRRTMYHEMLPREGTASTWARVYRNRYGEDAFRKAAEEAADERLSVFDRGLRVRVFSGAGRGPDSPLRDFVISTYRPYLDHPEVELRRAALQVNGALWDSEVLPRLKEIAHGQDPFNRSRANHLVRRYLTYGSHRPAQNETAESRSFRERFPGSDDREVLREWMQARPAWKREQDRLRGIERNAETPAPKKPSFKIRRADTQRESNVGPLRP